MGFTGLSYSGNTLSLDPGAAQGAGAVVTQYPDHVDVYQHSSPGVTLSFYSDDIAYKDKKITGTVKNAYYTTDPMPANLGLGKVSGSVHAELLSLTQKVAVNMTIRDKTSSRLADLFRSTIQAQDLDLDTLAYVLNIDRAQLEQSGAANITMTVPPAYLDAAGGKDAVRIVRVTADGNTTEVLATRFVGTDRTGNLRFEAYSPAGTSIFGLLTAKATTAKQMEEPNVTIQPLQKPALITEIGMFAWLLGILKDNPVVIVVIIAVIGVVLYGTWKRRQV